LLNLTSTRWSADDGLDDHKGVLMGLQSEQVDTYQGDCLPHGTAQHRTSDDRAAADGTGGGAIGRHDFLDYLTSMTADFAGLAEQAKMPRLCLLLDMVSAEATRERQRDA
jgi:hypothetical protein